MDENVLNTFPRLVAEMGEARLTLAVVTRPDRERECACTARTTDYGSLQEALADYLHNLGPARTRPRWAAIVLPCPLPHRPDRIVHLPECGWSFGLDKVRNELDFERLQLLENFAALCMAVPCLPGSQLMQLGGGAADKQGPIAVIELGRSLRTAILLPSGSGHAVVQGHGGQVDIAACTAEETSVAYWCKRRCGNAAADRILNARGMEVLHQALCELRGVDCAQRSTTDILRCARAGSDIVCADTVATFCAMLGTLAGNLALTLGASGGVYVAGLPCELVAATYSPTVRARFEHKGRVARHVSQIPLYLIRESACKLLGAAAALDTPPSFGVLDSWSRALAVEDCPP